MLLAKEGEPGDAGARKMKDTAGTHAADLTRSAAEQCRGFWKHSALLHAAAVRDGSISASGHVQMKDAILRDYSAWTFSAALVATVSLAGLLVAVSPADVESRPNGVWLAKHVYILSLALSAMLALSCVNDFISCGNYYNMVPAPFIIEAREHLYDARSKAEVEVAADHFGNASNVAKRAPITHVLRNCGLGYGSGVFYQSIASLCLGLTSFVYMAHGFQFCIPAAVVFFSFLSHIREYGRACHWDDYLLPELSKKKWDEEL